jgi:hypothetical protein
MKIYEQHWKHSYLTNLRHEIMHWIMLDGIDGQRPPHITQKEFPELYQNFLFGAGEGRLVSYDSKTKMYYLRQNEVQDFLEWASKELENDRG